MKKYVLMLAVSMLGLGLAAEPLEVASFAMENKGKVTSPSAGVYRMDGVSIQNPPGKSAQYCRQFPYRQL